MDLNLDYEDSDMEAEVGASSKTPPTHVMLSPPATKRKDKHKAVRTQTDRRVTVNLAPNDTEDYRCTLRDNTRDLAQEFSFATEADFVKLVEDNPGEIFETIKHLLAAYHTMDETSRSLQEELTLATTDNSQLEKRAEAQKQKISDLSKEHQEATAQVGGLESLIKAKEEEVAKLRRARNAHRDNFEKVEARARALIIDKQTLEKTIEGFERRLKNVDAYMQFEDSDREDPVLRFPGSRETGGDGHRRILRRDEPLPELRREPDRYRSEAPPPKHKYPELPLFYGDTTEWEAWKAHLMTKVQTDYYDFPLEWNKINYARDKTRGNAQATIWHRAKPDSLEPYKELKELIEDLSNVFGEEEQDKHRTLLQQLFSPRFAMGAKDRSETFERFLARFTSTISPLRLSDNDKIMHLYRNLSDQLTEKIYHLNGLVGYPEYVRGVRQVANQMKIRSDITHNAAAPTTSARGRIARTTDLARKDTGLKKPLRDRSRTKGQSPLDIMLGRLPAHIRQKFRKDGRCFKCGGKGHISVDKDAPCKDKDAITREKAEALLSEMGIEYTEADFAYWDEDDSAPEYLDEEAGQRDKQPEMSEN